MNDQFDFSDLLTVDQAAALIGISPNRLYELRAKGRFPAGVVIEVTAKRGLRFNRETPAVAG